MKLRDYIVVLSLWAVLAIVVAAAHSANRRATNARLDDLAAQGGGPLQAQINGLDHEVRSLRADYSMALQDVTADRNELRDSLNKFNELSQIRDSGQSKTIDDLRDRLNEVEAATADPAYVHSSKLPEWFNAQKDGKDFPRIIIDGEKLTFDEADKHYHYAEKHPFGIPNRAMWLQAGTTYLIATPDYTDPATGKVWVRHRSGRWYEDPSLAVKRKQIESQLQSKAGAK